MAALSKTVTIKFKADTRSAITGVKSLGKATDKLNGKSKRATDSSKASFAGIASGAQTAVAALAGVALAYDRIAQTSIQAQVAAQNLPFSIDKAARATKGLVDNLTLQQEALRASQFGVAKTSDEFARLTAAATKLGIAAGQDATTSVKDLTLALGRQSPKILDNLNIMLKLGDANAEYARRLGKSTAELTDNERKQAFMTIGLEKAEEAAAKLTLQVDDTALSFAQLKTATINAAQGFAVNFTKAISNASVALDGLIGDITGLNDELEALDAEAGPGRFSLFNPNLAENLELAKEAERVKRKALEDARLQAEIEDEIAEFERGALRTSLRNLDISLASATNEREKNRLLNEQAALRQNLLQLQGEGEEAEKVFFANFLRGLRFQAAQRKRAGKGDRFAQERAAFQAQLRQAREAEAFANIAGDRQAQAATRLFEIERRRAELAVAQGDRQREALAQQERILQLQQADLGRRQELAALQGDPATAAALEQEAFAAREESLRRQLELEFSVSERQAIEEQIRQVRHEATIARINEETRAREEQAARVQAVISTVSAAERGAFQLSATIASATIQGEERKKRALDAIKAGGLFADGAVAQAQALIAFASGNVPQGVALQAAALNAFAQGAVVAAGAARGGGGSSGGGTTAFGTGAGPQASQAAQGPGVSRGAPLSVAEAQGVQSQARTDRRARPTQNIEINANGTIDRDAAREIVRALESFDGRSN